MYGLNNEYEKNVENSVLLCYSNNKRCLKMSKIIKIDGEVISIVTDNGGIREVRTTDINFTPNVGDEVEIFETETNVIVTKKESKVEQQAQAINPAAGININSVIIKILFPIMDMQRQVPCLLEQLRLLVN